MELAELKNKVRVAQDQVTAFRQRTGVTDTTAKNASVEQALLGMLEGKLQDAENARRSAEVKAMSAQNANTATGSPAVQNLKALLNTQQTQLAQLRTTYGMQHPKVLELENQIHATQRSIPMPKPPCGTVPYLRRSIYQLKASRGSWCSSMRRSSSSGS